MLFAPIGPIDHYPRTDPAAPANKTALSNNYKAAVGQTFEGSVTLRNFNEYLINDLAEALSLKFIVNIRRQLFAKPKIIITRF